jgi:hypothetical protein
MGLTSNTIFSETPAFKILDKFFKIMLLPDIDECVVFGKMACGENSKCTNRPGTYDCTCKVGYYSPSGDGMNCEGE